MDAEREEDLREWMSHWDDIVDFEVIPVRNLRRSRRSDRTAALIHSAVRMSDSVWSSG